jgi:hypothetical protein
MPAFKPYPHVKEVKDKRGVVLVPAMRRADRKKARRKIYQENRELATAERRARKAAKKAARKAQEE